MDQYLHWIAEHFSFISPEELATCNQIIRGLEVQLASANVAWDGAARAWDLANEHLSHATIELERVISTSYVLATLVEEKTSKITFFSQCVKDLGGKVAS